MPSRRCAIVSLAALVEAAVVRSSSIRAGASVEGQRNLPSFFYPSIRGCTLPILCWCKRHSLPQTSNRSVNLADGAPASNGLFLWHILGQSRSTSVHNEVAVNRVGNRHQKSRSRGFLRSPCRLQICEISSTTQSRVLTAHTCPCQLRGVFEGRANLRCILDGRISTYFRNNNKKAACRAGRGLPGLSHMRGKCASVLRTGRTASPLPPTLSTTQEISAANVSRHSAGATRRPKTTTTASWRLALPWVSLGAG